MTNFQGAFCKSCSTVTTYLPNVPKDSIVQCTSLACGRYICTIEKCFRIFQSESSAINHQNKVHRNNADPHKCYFCKGPKVRSGAKEAGQCPTCGIYWCLYKLCNFEFSTMAGVLKHKAYAKHMYPMSQN